MVTKEIIKVYKETTPIFDEVVRTFKMDKLQDKVFKLLTNKHGVLDEDAESRIEKSRLDDPSIWHDDADPEKLAELLAEEDDDE